MRKEGREEIERGGGEGIRWGDGRSKEGVEGGGGGREVEVVGGEQLHLLTFSLPVFSFWSSISRCSLT